MSSDTARAARAAANFMAYFASIGLSFFPSKDISTPDLLVKYADEALYRAKREGRNCICLYQGQTYRYDVAAR